jgi:hypothetical protein
LSQSQPTCAKLIQCVTVTMDRVPNWSKYYSNNTGWLECAMSEND